MDSQSKYFTFITFGILPTTILIQIIDMISLQHKIDKNALTCYPDHSVLMNLVSLYDSDLDTFAILHENLLKVIEPYVDKTICMYNSLTDILDLAHNGSEYLNPLHARPLINLSDTHLGLAVFLKFAFTKPSRLIVIWKMRKYASKLEEDSVTFLENLVNINTLERIAELKYAIDHESSIRIAIKSIEDFGLSNLNLDLEYEKYGIS